MINFMEIDIMKNQLTTDRLSISIMTLDDADLLYDLDQDPNVMKYINGGVLTSRADINNIYIPRLKSYLKPVKGWGLWKVFNKNIQGHADDRDNFVGWVLIRPMGFFTETPEFDNLEIGWRFKKSAWGQGFATESAKAIIDLLIKHQLDVVKFSAIADENNVGSINIMKKLGMQFINKQQHPDVVGDAEVVLYSMEVIRT